MKGSQIIFDYCVKQAYSLGELELWSVLDTIHVCYDEFCGV